MNPKDLAKFSPGDKTRMAMDLTFLGDEHGPLVSFSLGDSLKPIWIDPAAIVAIGRVRPALPGAWTWDGDDAVYIEGGEELGRIGHNVMSLIGADTMWHPVEITQVIEAVRNA